MQHRPANLVSPSRARTLVVLVLCTLLSVALLLSFPRLGNPLAVILGKALVALLLATLLTAYFYSRRERLHRHAERVLIDVPNDQAYKLQRSAGRTSEVSFLQAKIFALAIAAPSELRQRLIERYDPSPRALRHEMTIISHVPANMRRRKRNGTLSAVEAAVGPVLFPVLVPRKGELSDNFVLRMASGENVPVLSHREYLQLVAGVLRTLLASAYQLRAGQTLEEACPDAVHAEHAALAEVVQRSIALKTPSAYSGAKKLAALERADAALEVKNPEVLGLAVKLVEKLSVHYAVVAAVPVGEDGRFVLTFERTVVPTLDLTGERQGALDWAKGRLRVVFGARPINLTVSLEGAWTSQSYHLFVHSEEGLYLGVQESRTLASYVNRHARNPLPAVVAPPYYRFRKRFGQSYAHFYSRYFPEPRVSEEKFEPEVAPEPVPTVTFQFYERPPGSVFRATVAATACVLLVWLVGYLVERINVNQLQTDAPAILLAFPAIAAAWLGFEQPTRRLLEGTLTARISLAVTVVVSILASGLFMAYQGSAQMMRSPAPLEASVFGVHTFAWATLVIVAFLNAGITALVYVLRSWDFMYLASRENPDGGVIEAG
jgi:hypothetical protein